MLLMKQKRLRLVTLCLMIMLAFGVGTVVGGITVATAVAQSNPDTPKDFAVFWEAWAIIQAHFIDRDVLDTKELTYGAIQGLVTALGDDGHTTFLTPSALERQQSAMAGSFSGIGAQLGVKEGLPVIIAPIDDSPAAEAGIKPGDIILGVDGEDVTSLTLDEIVDKVRGPAGTEVVLTLLREGESSSIEVKLVRREIKVAAVSWTMVPGTKVALVRLNQFSATAKAEIVEAYKALKAAGAESLILDIRNNPGGLLTQAISVTSQFLKNGNVLQEENAQGRRRAFRVESGGVATEIPMVVLINPGSASSSEIFAGAIQDHERGQLIGETTFGTGTVLQTFTLEDGSALLLGTSQWLTADGRLIRKQGIKPDVEVVLPADGEFLTPTLVKALTADEVATSGDAQLLAGLKALNALPETTLETTAAPGAAQPVTSTVKVK